MVNAYIVVFDPEIKPWDVVPLPVRVEQEVIAMKGYSTFHKVPRFKFCTDFISNLTTLEILSTRQSVHISGVSFNDDDDDDDDDNDDIINEPEYGHLLSLSQS